MQGIQATAVHEWGVTAFPQAALAECDGTKSRAGQAQTGRPPCKSCCRRLRIRCTCRCIPDLTRRGEVTSQSTMKVKNSSPILRTSKSPARVPMSDSRTSSGRWTIVAPVARAIRLLSARRVTGSRESQWSASELSALDVLSAEQIGIAPGACAMRLSRVKGLRVQGCLQRTVSRPCGA